LIEFLSRGAFAPLQTITKHYKTHKLSQIIYLPGALLDMAEAFNIRNQTINAEELMSLLISNDMLPHFLYELIVSEAIASITYTPEELAKICHKFFKQHQITNSLEHERWLQHFNLSEHQFQALVTRKLRIEKFQQQTWGYKLESYFLQRKKHLDQAIYSIIRTQDSGIAQELYFRLLAGEQSFSELARTYSTGIEADRGGIVGPVELGTLHSGLARQLQASQPGQLWQPSPLGQHIVIVRLEKLLPAQLDKFMRQRLLRELFDNWLQEQIDLLSNIDKAWLRKSGKQAQIKPAVAA
jgi:PPIC-type PPIASE domain